MHIPPEILNADANYETALARLANLEADSEITKIAAREAAQKVAVAEQRLATEKGLLIAAKAELTTAMDQGLPTEVITQRVSACIAKIESLETLRVTARANAAAADKRIANASARLGQAQSDIAAARFTQLIAHIAAIVGPAIPLCRELHKLSHRLGIGLQDSGYVLDVSKPRIGRYLLDDNGDIRFHQG